MTTIANMKISVDISLYPLKDDYLPAIESFIERADATPGINVVKNRLSTQLFGDYDQIMDWLKVEFKRTYEEYGQGIFATRFLMGDLSQTD